MSPVIMGEDYVMCVMNLAQVYMILACADVKCFVVPPLYTPENLCIFFVFTEFGLNKERIPAYTIHFVQCRSGYNSVS